MDNPSLSSETAALSSSQDLVEQAVTLIRNNILEGKYGPEGELPSQGQICIELGVSRSVVREAMRILQSQGLLEISQGRRPRVLPPNPSMLLGSLETLMQRSSFTMFQLIEFRRPLEVEIAGLAAQRIKPNILEQLRTTIHGMEYAKDRDEEVAEDMRFHQLLADGSGNPICRLMLDVLATLLKESRYLTLQESGRETALFYHKQIFAAVEARNPSAARDAMLAHMNRTKVDIERVYQAK